MPHPTDALADRLILAARRESASLARRLELLAARRLPAAEFLRRAWAEVLRSEGPLMRSARETILASWLTGGRSAVRGLPPPRRDSWALTDDATPPEPFTRPDADPSPAGGPTEPPVRLPVIEHAAKSLARRRVMTRGDFDTLDADAKSKAFTVARVQSLDAIEKIRDAVATAAAQGESLRDFTARVKDVAELAPAHAENVYRTNLAAAYSEGQRAVLDHPLVSSEFPYVLWVAVHDSRTRPEHLAMEKGGIGGTAVYRRDDPVIILRWPPASFQCRCHVIPLSVEDADARGVPEAKDWLRTGDPPATPAWVDAPAWEPPPGWSAAGPP